MNSPVPYFKFQLIQYFINIDIHIFKKVHIDIDIFKKVHVQFKNDYVDIDINIDIFQIVLIDIDTDIDIDIFQKCRYIDNRYLISIYRTGLDSPPHSSASGISTSPLMNAA